MARVTEKTASLELVAAPAIEKRIFVVRGRQVMLDEDLADLYGVETKRLVEQVKRNVERFPADFMFRSEEHTSELQSQFHLVCRLLLEKKNAIVDNFALDHEYEVIRTLASPDFTDAGPDNTPHVSVVFFRGFSVN